MQSTTKLPDIFKVASGNFIWKGYRQTQIADIAKELSMSTGAIYNIFTSKKAIFQFVLHCIFDDNYLNGDMNLPIDEIDTADLMNLIQGVFDKFTLKYGSMLDTAPERMLSFKDLLSNIYDMLSKYGIGFLIFEHNEVSWPEISRLYYEYRKKFIELLEKYLLIYIQNSQIRDIEQVEYHTRLIVETLAWWGMHRKFDRTHRDIEDSVAKAVVLDALIHAYEV